MNSTAWTSHALSQSAVPLAARMLLAAIFLVSGVGKAIDPAGTMAYIASAGLPSASMVYAATLCIELGGGLLLLIGFRTRWAAAVLGLFAIASALIFHHALGDQNQLIHFLKNLAIAGGMLQVIAYGAGDYSVDRRGWLKRPAA